LTVDELNAAGPAEARNVLEACCASSRWIEGMIARRPFDSVASVLAAADEVWSRTEAEDWLEAFSYHPRIGERIAAAPQGELAAGWSAGEQSLAGTSAQAVQDDLAEMNCRYEERFGYIYIVCATGKSAEELLAMARVRLLNDPDKEIHIAAGEQHKITRLRLRKLFEANS
jgi:2-oxo-4-hydroxy-4-carboxy-5-ureidoimidazoline decarboxylase